MGQELDSLEVKIQATATKAINSVDKLITGLTKLSGSLSTINGSSLTNLANGVDTLGSAMRNMDAKTADFTRLAKNITKLGSVDSVALSNTATSLTAVMSAVDQLSTVNSASNEVKDFASSLGKLGSKSIEHATDNIPKLGNALNGLMVTLSRAPSVNSSVIQMTNALANLASQGSKVGSASNSIQTSLKGVSTRMTSTKRTATSLAAIFGKLYANYFLLIRGSKGLINSIKSTTEYIEAFNYQAVAFGKIASEWDREYEKYGYENAEVYGKSFQKRVQQTLGKLSGLQVDMEKGLLVEAGTKNLGLNIQEITQYASQLASVTNSLGQTGEATTAITKSMTMLAGDISSLFNVDYSTVATNLQSGLIGQSRALYKYGIDITNATLANYAYNLGVEKSISEMSQMEKQQLRVLAILDQSRVSWADLANTINSPSNMMRQFRNNLRETGMVLGQLFIPMLNNVMPVVNGVTIAIKRLLVNFATLMGVKIDFDSFGQAGYKDTTDGLEDIADGYDDVADSAKKAAMSLMGFDEINKLQADTSSNKGGSAGGTIDLTADIIKATEEYEKRWNEAFSNMENDAIKWADRVEKILKPVTTPLNNLVSDIRYGNWYEAGQDVSDLAEAILDSARKALKIVKWDELGEDVGLFLKGINWTKILKEVINLKFDIWKAIIDVWTESFEEAPFETLLLTSFALCNFTPVGSLIGNKLFSATSTSVKGLNWSSIGNYIGMTIGSAIGGYLAGNKINEFLTGEKIDMSFTEQIDYLWESALSGELFDKKVWENTASDLTKAPVDALNAMFDQLDTDMKERMEELKKQYEESAKNMLPTFFESGQSVANNILDGIGRKRLPEVFKGTLKDMLSQNVTSEAKNLGGLIATSINTGMGKLDLKKPVNDSLRELINTVTSYGSSFGSSFMNAFNSAVDNSKDGIRKVFGNIFGDFKLSLNTGTAVALGGGAHVGIDLKANGGYVDTGQMFIAREAGPEMVGTMNGRTAVANNEQITTGIRDAVYDAMISVLSATQSNNRSGNITVNIDGKAVFSAVQTQANNYERRTGRPAFG